MRIESCRKCGTELKLSKTCSVCSKPIQFYCKYCKANTEEQIHLDCYLDSFEEQLFRVTESVNLEKS